MFEWSYCFLNVAEIDAVLTDATRAFVGIVSGYADENSLLKVIQWK